MKFNIQMRTRMTQVEGSPQAVRAKLDELPAYGYFSKVKEDVYMYVLSNYEIGPIDLMNSSRDELNIFISQVYASRQGVYSQAVETKEDRVRVYLTTTLRDHAIFELVRPQNGLWFETPTPYNAPLRVMSHYGIIGEVSRWEDHTGELEDLVTLIRLTHDTHMSTHTKLPVGILLHVDNKWITVPVALNVWLEFIFKLVDPKTYTISLVNGTIYKITKTDGSATLLDFNRPCLKVCYELLESFMVPRENGGSSVRCNIDTTTGAVSVFVNSDIIKAQLLLRIIEDPDVKVTHESDDSLTLILGDQPPVRLPISNKESDAEELAEMLTYLPEALSSY